MGDVVLQTAVVNFLRAFLGKELKITFLTSNEFKSLIEGHDEINQVIGFDRRRKGAWKDLMNEIKSLHHTNPIDLILDLHGTLRSLRLKYSLWKIPNLTVDKRRIERFILTKIKFPFLKKLFSLDPQVIRVIKDFESFFDSTLGVWKTKEFRKGPNGELTSLPKPQNVNHPRPYLVISPSASFESKRWPIENYMKLTEMILEKTSYDVVVLAGPMDHFCQKFDGIKNQRLFNLQGKTSLKESMNYLNSAKICIGNDSGMNHIAEAYGVPVLTLFGSTDPRFGFLPHGEKSRYIYKSLWCSPCSTTGKKDCFRSEHFCMQVISPEEVMSQVSSMLEMS